MRPTCYRRPAHCDATLPRPRVYFYAGPLPPWNGESNWRWKFLRELLERSEYHEADGDCADFYIVGNHLDWDRTARYGSRCQNSTKVELMFESLARRWPWWQRTTAAGQRRHLLLTPCDHGPGDCMYSPHFAHKKNPVAPHLAPSNPDRLVGFLTPTGAGGAVSWFLPGVDIRLPQDEPHVLIHTAAPTQD